MLFHFVMLYYSSIILVILLQSSKKNIQAFFVYVKYSINIIIYVFSFNNLHI